MIKETRTIHFAKRKNIKRRRVRGVFETGIIKIKEPRKAK